MNLQINIAEDMISLEKNKLNRIKKLPSDIPVPPGSGMQEDIVVINI